MKYKTPKDFRMGVQEKLKEIAKKEGIDIVHLYRQVAFTQFLARLFKEKEDFWALKGGHFLELVFKEARATKDVDLAVKDSNFFQDNIENLKEELIKRARIDLGDFFEFEILGPKMELTNAPYGGWRFLIDSKIDGKTFSKFDLDIGFGDVWIEPHPEMELKNHLDLRPVKIRVISVEQCIAEKIHAYTLPREGRTNSRVKDLVDLYLLIEEGKVDKKELKIIVEKTFERRKTHGVPKELDPPPESWGDVFKGFEIGVTMEDAYKKINLFWKMIN
jgi:predicted nucleotidyltransferase component of viral defense system